MLLVGSINGGNTVNVAIVLQKPMYASKTRLKGWLSPMERSGLIEAMLSDVLTQLSQVNSLDYYMVVTCDPSAIQLANQYGAKVFYEESVQGMNQAIMTVQHTLRRNVENLFILPADIPLISFTEIEHIVEYSKDCSMTIIPCRKSIGTNGLILSPPKLMNTAFGIGSLKEHCEIASRQAIDYKIFHSESFSCDIDTIDDLLYIEQIGSGTKTKEYLFQNNIYKKLKINEVAT